MVPYLTRFTRLIGFDFPGFGGTDPIPEVDSIEKMADWAGEVIQALGLKKFVLTGHSMGGYVAVHYAEKFPEKVAALGMIHSTAAPDRPFKKENRDRTIYTIGRYGYYEFLRKWVPELFQQKRQEYIDRIIELGDRADPETVIRIIEAMRDRPDMRPFLHSLKIPVMFVLGRHDHIIDLPEVRDQLMSTEKARNVMLEAACHMGMYEDPDGCAKALAGLMTSLKIES